MNLVWNTDTGLIQVKTELPSILNTIYPTIDAYPPRS